MPIVSHTIDTNEQPDGRSYNVLRLYDQDGREFMQTYWAPAGFNHTAKVTAVIADIDEQLQQDEFEQIVGL